MRGEIMAKRNNGYWKIIATVSGILFVMLGAAIGYGMLYSDVEKMKPEVPLNTEHRIKFEEKVQTMETNIALILEEVRKDE